MGLFDGVALLDDEEWNAGRKAVELKRLERYRKSQKGRLAASINAGDSRMVAESPEEPQKVHEYYRVPYKLRDKRR